ncbi:MAG: bifunctional demethylmenaquinone methyltransferase/2-methoxy-6-polyprenyl-1,4-benzoquinol methylase UbiE [Acidobacteria bacterium]|nr:bifunctional demethylmenaquinone methyltransferase/2-methoxy-6-polyprenyl-1,4-benzoquinol methylase UbiE [Acidobacteriota bacterium]MCA1608581.1 bifunctional demethylmenaquinone methyltransferase/2-methoxy-6-polyprenyl-1,4-benzoquinol methylase UbiE [Acidobacteriota bacterium]
MAHQPTVGEDAHARAVREMFSGIAPKYDRLNHLLSLNIDKRWRRLVREKLADVLYRPDAVVLDVACGTGDLSFELKRNSPAKVVGTDFCRPMLTIASEKSAAETLSLPFIESDALRLPFASQSFDALTIAFGLRNLANIEAGLYELSRVLKSGGKLIVLEFSTPVIPGFRQLFSFYFNKILPRIGGAVSGSREAYKYLPDSVSKFPSQIALAELMRSIGLEKVEYKNLTGGIAAIHLGSAPDPAKLR